MSGGTVGSNTTNYYYTLVDVTGVLYIVGITICISNQHYPWNQSIALGGLKDMDTLGCVADLGPHVLLAGERSRFALKRIKGRRSSLVELELTLEREMRLRNR